MVLMMGWQRKLRLLKNLLVPIKTLSMLGIYVGFAVVVVALLTMQAPRGSVNYPNAPWSYTPAVPPALECLISLTVQFFGLYLAILVVDTYNAIKLDGQRTFLQDILDQAKDTVRFCPLLATMFIAARLR